MFRIKVCGITNVEAGQSAAAAGVDAIGLNFYERSPRCVSAEVARLIATALPAGIVKVGVFVNAPRERVLELVERVGLDAVQLHGEESAEFVVSLSVPVIKAFRPQNDLGPIREFLNECEIRGKLPRMVLVDAYRPEQYGGTGERADWQCLAGCQNDLLGLPLVLAGGLVPENVGEAILQVRPAAVDTASGVEIAPGRKSAQRMQAFAVAARLAFEKLVRSS